ncbi:hypothetical protein JGK46_001550 [Aeromonas bestiarum]|nr:hypothetical protein [Aeromonas bestiarum]
MKKTILMVCITILSLNVQAGTAIIPAFYTLDKAGQSCFTISNISNENASVSVKLYGKDGSTSDYGFVSRSIIPSLNTPFILESRKTAYFCVTSGGKLSPGHGVIDSQPQEGSSGQVFLVANGFYENYTKDYTLSFNIPVNNGMPF